MQENIYSVALKALLSVITTDKDGGFTICEEASPLVDRCQAIVDGKIDHMNDMGDKGFDEIYEMGYMLGLSGEEYYDGEHAANLSFWEGYRAGFDLFKINTQG